MGDDIATPAIASFLREHSYLPLVVEYLADCDETWCSVDELTEYLHEQTGDDLETIRIQLVHSHIPRMADYGAVEYDSHAQTIQHVDEDIIDGLHEQLS